MQLPCRLHRQLEGAGEGGGLLHDVVAGRDDHHVLIPGPRLPQRFDPQEDGRRRSAGHGLLHDEVRRQGDDLARLVRHQGLPLSARHGAHPIDGDDVQHPPQGVLQERSGAAEGQKLLRQVLAGARPEARAAPPREDDSV